MKRFGVAAITLAVASIAMGGTANAGPVEEHPIMKAMHYAESQWPEEFAGTWLDLDYWGEDHVFDGSEDSFAPDRKIFFGFTEGAEEKVALLRAAFPAPNPYVAVDHEYSYKYLLDLQRRFIVDSEMFKAGQLEVPGGRFTWYGAGVYVVKNVLEVTMPEDMLTPEFLAWAADRYGPAARFNDGPALVPVGGPGLKGNRPGGKGSDGSGREACGKACRRAKKNRQLVRKCNKARKSSSAKKKRFSKSKKCRKARSKLA